MDIEMSSSARSGTSNGWNGVKDGLKKFYAKIDTPENGWKYILFICVVSLAIDPLFFFIPEIDYQRLCIGYDKTLGDLVAGLRLVVDSCYMVLVVEAMCSKTSLMRVNMNKVERVFYSIVDMVSILPIPVIMVFSLGTEWSNDLVSSKRILKWIIVCQYIPRIIRIYPIYKAITKTSVSIAESKWIGALINLLLFLFFSHVFGAFWYLTAIEKVNTCWHEAWGNKTITMHNAWPRQDNRTKLFCTHLPNNETNSVVLNNSCTLTDPSEFEKFSKILKGVEVKINYDFGMYDAVVKSMVGSKDLRDFPKRFMYCFWWGLRNLSTFAQGLATGDSASDNFFAVIICSSGLFLVAVLIGNVQKYLLTSTVRADEMEERKKDTEKWMTFRKLPEHLKKRIKKNQKTIWKNMRGTDEESLLRTFPEDLRRETEPYLDNHTG